MKRILITGKDSYIGTSFEDYLTRKSNNYKINTIQMKDDLWEKEDFSQFDVVFHVAGIAHIKETTENKELYYKVNRDLAYKTALKAKKDGVKQFVFLSSMSVYGLDHGVISENTPLNATSAYGKSKAEAEQLVQSLADDTFIVAILRPPVVYGKGCKGNYPRLVRLTLKTPIFPNVNNKRSMIYINNLSEFVKQVIDHERGGVLFPQNTEYVNVSEMVELIAMAHGKKVRMIKLFSPLLGLLNLITANKIFGDLIYEKEMSNTESEYRVCGFKQSIIETEGIKESVMERKGMKE